MKSIQVSENPCDVQTHFLYAGTIYVSQTPSIISTVLGSCVSVCLWDTVQHYGGMNHYQLPYWNGNGLASPKYGNVSIELLLDKMDALKCQKKNLVAKLFGGASMLHEVIAESQAIGKRNIDVAKLLLTEAGIRVVASNLGGNYGRKLKFNTKTGEVLMQRRYLL